MTNQVFKIVTVLRVCDRCLITKSTDLFRPGAHICQKCVLYGGSVRGRITPTARSYSLTDQAHDVLAELRKSE